MTVYFRTLAFCDSVVSDVRSLKLNGIDAAVYSFDTSDTAAASTLRADLDRQAAQFPFALLFRGSGEDPTQQTGGFALEERKIGSHKRSLSAQALGNSQDSVGEAMEFFVDPSYVHYDGVPLVLVEGRGATDTANAVRRRMTNSGLGEVFVVAVVEAAEHDSVPTGIDAVVVRPEPEGPGVSYLESAIRSLARPHEAPRFSCVRPSPAHDIYERWVAAAVAAGMTEATTRGNHHTLLFVDGVGEATPEQLQAHSRGLLRGLISAPTVPDTTNSNMPPSSPRAPVLSVAIVAQSDAEATMRCLRAALDTATSIEAVEYVVVDNASGDETAPMLHLLRDRVKSTRFDTPIPLEDAWTAATKLAHGRFIVMVSNDVVLQPGWHLRPLAQLALDATTNAIASVIAVEANGSTVPSQPPTVNSGVCITIRGGSPWQQSVANARVDPQSLAHEPQRAEADHR